MSDPWTAQTTETLGAFIRSQRELAQLSLRQLAEMTKLSHPYLSQVERGMHQPSVRVLKLLSEALNVSAETLLMQAGLLEGDGQAASDADMSERVKAAIRADRRLSDAQQAALIAVYDSMLRDWTRRISRLRSVYLAVDAGIDDRLRIDARTLCALE